GRLVQDEDLGGLVDDGHGDGGVGRQALVDPLGHLDFHYLALTDPPRAVPDGRAVEPHATTLQEPGCLAAGQPGQQREHAVDSLAVEGAGHRLLHRPGADRSREKLTSTSRMQPAVMAMSATLNTGHHRRSTKSTTDPLSRPGARKRRSARLPTAPPVTSPRATATAGLAAARPTLTSTTTNATTARATKGTNPEPSPKAPPVLWLSASRVGPIRVIVLLARESTAHHLVSWSAATTATATAAANRYRRRSSSPRLACSDFSGGRAPRSC